MLVLGWWRHLVNSDFSRLVSRYFSLVAFIVTFDWHKNLKLLLLLFSVTLRPFDFCRRPQWSIFFKFAFCDVNAWSKFCKQIEDIFCEFQISCRFIKLSTNFYLYLVLPASLDRSYNFTCVSLFFCLFIKSSSQNWLICFFWFFAWS